MFLLERFGLPHSSCVSVRMECIVERFGLPHSDTMHSIRITSNQLS